MTEVNATAYIRYDHVVMWRKTEEDMTALIRYHEAVMWKTPGGNHHVKILHKGDEVTVIQGWRYNERAWDDKRYIKVCKGCQTGYILAEALTDGEVNMTPYNYEEDEEECLQP